MLEMGYTSVWENRASYWSRKVPMVVLIIKDGVLLKLIYCRWCVFRWQKYQRSRSHVAQKSDRNCQPGKFGLVLKYVVQTTLYERRHEISNNVVCATSKGSDQPAYTRSLIRAFASRLNIL